MHRHSYQGRKLSRDTDQRRALVRGLVTSLVLHETIQTTEAKAKTVTPLFDKLVTTAKLGTLASRRALATELLTENAAKKLLTEILPSLSDRSSGYTRMVKLPNRSGDNASMVQLSLVAKPIVSNKKEAIQPKAIASKPAKESKVEQGATHV